MKFIPLSFISSILELKRQIINTVVFSDLSAKFPVASLENYLDGTQYGFTASAKETGEYKLVRITDINDGSVEWNAVPYCDCDTPNNYLLSDNDILVARTGGTTGKSFLVQHAPDNAIYASYLIRLRPAEDVNPLFIHAFLNSYNYWSQISELKSGSAQPNVNAEKLKKLQLPLCSTEIQKQVVSLIYSQESTVWPDIVSHITNTLDQFDQIKAYETELQTQQSLLAKLRQSILQEAVQGKLTERWRRERSGLKQAGVGQVAGSNSVGGSSNEVQTTTANTVTSGGTGSSPVRTANQSDETGAELLARIRAEKAELIRQGKLRKEKPLPPITDAEKPFELPDGWVWCRLGEISTKTDSGWSPACNSTAASENVWGVLKTTSVQEMLYLQHENKELPARLSPRPQYQVEAGDILITRAGPKNRVGVCCVVKETRPKLMISDKIVRIHLHESLTNANYVGLSLNIGASKDYIEDRKTGMADSQVNISQDNLKLTPIPFPPLAEQQTIVAQVDEALAQVSELESENRQQQAEVGRLMQAVLREAFAGKEVVEN